MKHISSRENPFYKQLAGIADSARQRAKAGQTLLDGAHLLAAYLDAGQRPQHVLLNAAALCDEEIAALLARMDSVPVTQLDDRLFAQLTELKTPTGILSLIDIPQAETDIAVCRFALLLEDIQDPGNLGSMLRTAAAAGCDAVFLSKGCADAWSPRVLRAGMGGHFALAVNEVADLAALAQVFPGIAYAAMPDVKTGLYECDLRGPVAFAIGNEGAGLSAALAGCCKPVAIPMPGRVESLNAAAATAVCLFEAVRQRR